MPPAHLLTAYGLFILTAGAIWHLVADGEFSAILTLSGMVQCLAFVLLALQTISTNSASGISGKALSLNALAICCRLSSTVWLNGYLPVDATGDYIYQCIDILSLSVLVWLLHQVLVVKRHTYQAEEDSLSVVPFVVGALVLAAVFHGNMDGMPIFDILWMTSVFVSTIAVLPQLWLITRTGGRVAALTSHYIVAMAASSALSGIFMWHAREDITCDPWITGLTHASWVILAAHLLHMVLLCDFAFYYVKAVIAQGLNCQVEIEVVCDHV